MRTINDLFDALMGELEGLDTGRAREIVGEIRSRVLTPEAVDGLPKEVCEAIGVAVREAIVDLRGPASYSGRCMASAVAAHLCVVRPSGNAGELDEPTGCLAMPDHEPYTGEDNARHARATKLLRKIEWPEFVEPDDMIPLAESIASAVRELFGNSEELDPRPIISDASQATEDQCRAVFNAASKVKRSPKDHVGFGRDFLAAALSAVRLDASPKPVLTEAEVRAFDGVFERAEKHANSCGKPGLWRDELHTARAALARLKAGSAKLPHEMHPPFEGDQNQESFAKKPVLDTAEADKPPSFADVRGMIKSDVDPVAAVRAGRDEWGEDGPMRISQDPESTLSTAEADKIIGEIEQCERGAGRDLNGETGRLLKQLRGKLVPPKPRRLTSDQAWAVSVFAAKRHADVPTPENGHAIAAEVARLWGLPAPEPETPKVRRLKEAEAKALANKSNDIISGLPLTYDGHAIADYVCRLLGLEYPS